MTAKLRIVVADDEADTREYLMRVVPRFGHDIVGVASDGAKLIEECERALPDLVVTDQLMPGMTGDEAIRRLWSRTSTPVVLISAFAEPDGLSGSCPPGARVVHLAKPFTGADLSAAIDEAGGRATASAT